MRHFATILILLFVLAGWESKAQSSDAADGKQYYVTIGVFAVHNNAIRFTAKANKAGFHAAYAINPLKKWYYVYLLETTDRRKAYAFLIKLKLDTPYKDAWVFDGHLGEDTQTPVVEKKEEVKVEPIVVAPTEPPVKEEPIVKVDTAKPTPVVEPPKKKVAKGKFFVFKLVNEENGNGIRGEIHLQESKRASQYQAYKADELVDITSPRNPDGTYFVTTVAPGYQTLETAINFKDPLPSSSGTGPDGEIIIPFSLKRAKRGDYIEFNNVSFYRNSVILQPQSQLELDGLVDLMKEHQNYKVKIHGHCNGTEARDIVTLGTSTKFFESDPGNKKVAGSAKELTELRAETARRYLVSQGIDVERILTKGEGGKMMVYPQNSVYANYNDRIEIEVIRH